MSNDVSVIIDVANQSITSSNTSIIGVPTENFEIVTFDNKPCIRANGIQYATFTINPAVKGFFCDVFLQAVNGFTLLIEFDTILNTKYSLVYYPYGKWTNPDNLVFDSNNVLVGVWVTVTYSSSNKTITFDNGTNKLVRVVNSDIVDLSIGSWNRYNIYLTNLSAETSSRYLNGTGLSEVWTNTKNYISAQLLGYSQTGHTHTKSQITDLDLSNFVDKTSNQTISGPKTFTSVPSVKKDSAGDLLYLIDDTINTSNEDENGLPLTGHTNSLKIRGHDGNMLPCMLTGQVFINGDTSAELRTYKYKDITSTNGRASFVLRYSYNTNSGTVYFNNISYIIPNVTNTTNLGSPSLQWNSTYTRHIRIDNDINIWSSVINKTSNSGSLALRSGNAYADGASIILYGKNYNSIMSGVTAITAYGDSDYTIFYIYPNGTMSVYNNSINTTKNIAMQEDVNTLLNGKANSSHTHTKSEITDFPTLATVATSGSYNDLSDKPIIPDVSNYYTKAEVDALISNAGISPSTALFIGEPYSLVNSAETNLGNYEEVSND